MQQKYAKYAGNMQKYEGNMLNMQRKYAKICENKD